MLMEANKKYPLVYLQTTTYMGQPNVKPEAYDKIVVATFQVHIEEYDRTGSTQPINRKVPIEPLQLRNSIKPVEFIVDVQRLEQNWGTWRRQRWLILRAVYWTLVKRTGNVSKINKIFSDPRQLRDATLVSAPRVWRPDTNRSSTFDVHTRLAVPNGKEFMALFTKNREPLKILVSVLTKNPSQEPEDTIYDAETQFVEVRLDIGTKETPLLYIQDIVAPAHVAKAESTIDTKDFMTNAMSAYKTWKNWSSPTVSSSSIISDETSKPSKRK